MEKHQLIFATANPHKLEEVRALLPGSIEQLSLKDIGFEQIPELGDTLVRNATAKAYHVHKKTGLDCFADDSGLMAEALASAPGVHSARYAGPNATDAQNVRLLLQNMQGKENRKAMFQTAILLIYNGVQHLFTGEITGTITDEPRGSNGFGYDPVFLPEGHDKTFAEMSPHEKNAISHRGRALEKLAHFFERQQQVLSWAKR